MSARALPAAALLLAACQAPGPAAPADPCGPGAFEGAATLPLPPAEPAPAQPGKGPLRSAGAVRVGGGVGDIGEWRPAGGDRSAWRLVLSAEGASSLSVHAYPFSLPPGVELWVCSPEGGVRHGPYGGDGPAGSGHLWTPAVPGPRLGLVLIGDQMATPLVKFQVAEAFVGFR